jgi:hypothetical protein
MILTRLESRRMALLVGGTAQAPIARGAWTKFTASSCKTADGYIYEVSATMAGAKLISR